MKVVAITAPSSHFTGLMKQLAAGIESTGDTVEAAPVGYPLPANVDAVLAWGWRRAQRFVKQGIPTLVMERGYVGDRFHWTSLGWNGLNGRAKFPKPKYSRLGMFCFDQWRDPNARTVEGNPGYALILGQVPGDAACANVNLAYQYRAWRDFLVQRGHAVKFRHHPHAKRFTSPFRRGETLSGTLAEDLAGAKFTVSWNSNASVDSVLAGVPSVTLDEGAMAYAVTSHDLANPVTMPSRTEWAAQLAWCQWQPSELSDGTAWKAVKEAMPR